LSFGFFLVVIVNCISREGNPGRERVGIALFLFLVTQVKLLMGIEPMTSSLPRMCSTAELQEPFNALNLKDQMKTKDPETQASETAKGKEPLAT